MPREIEIEEIVCRVIAIGLIFIFISVLWWAAAAHAENLCVAPYGIRNPTFKYNKFKSTLAGVEKYRMVFIWDSFGNANDALVSELCSSNVTGVEMVLINENCAKEQYGPKGRCKSHDFLNGIPSKKLTKLLRKQDPVMKGKIQAFANQACTFVNANITPDKERFLSPLLETTQPRDAYEIAATWIKEVLACSDYKFVWNPIGAKPGAAQVPAEISEGHGPSPKLVAPNCAANLDGSAPDDKDYGAYAVKYSGCAIGGCLWDLNYNLLNRGETAYIEPWKRVQKDTSGFRLVGDGLRAAQAALLPVPEWDSTDELSVQGCTKTFGAGSENPYTDGAGGFIYKQSHVDDASHAGTILFPARYQSFDYTINSRGKRIDKVEIWKNGQRYINVKYSPGNGFPDQAAGNKLRPIYRFDKDLLELPYNIVVRGVKNSKTFCWRIHNSRTRND